MNADKTVMTTAAGVILHLKLLEHYLVYFAAI